MVALRGLGIQLYKVFFSSILAQRPCQNSLETKPVLILSLTKSCQYDPQDLYHPRAFGGHGIVNPNGLFLKHLGSGVPGIVLVIRSLIPGSDTGSNLLDIY